MTQDEIQAVARAIEDQLTAEEGWMVGTPAIKRMCEDFAQAAIRALDAARGKAEPVAWMYHYPGELEYGFQRYEFQRRIQSYEGMSCSEEDAGMIETPLYAHPPAPDAARGDPVARLIAHMKTIEPDEETAGCPATWADFIQILEGIAEAGEPFHD